MSQSSQVVCQNCTGAVRVPTERLRDQPRCPRCHTPLFDGNPFELTEQSFDAHLKKNDLPLVVDFWAPWCAPCRMMAPAYEQVASEMEPGARFAKLNTDLAQGIAGRYGIRSIPTLIVFKGGREVVRQPGAMDPMSLRSWLRSAVG